MIRHDLTVFYHASLIVVTNQHWIPTIQWEFSKYFKV